VPQQGERRVKAASRREAYLPGHQLQGVLLERLHLVQPGRDDLLQLLEAVRLERHPGQTLETSAQQLSR